MEETTVAWPAMAMGVRPLWLSALITPPLLCAEHTRRWLYKIGRPDLVALTSTAYAAVLVGFALIVPHSHADATTGVLGWVLAGTVATLSALFALRPTLPSWRRSVDCLRRHRRFAAWLMLTNLPYAIYSSASIVILIAIFDGPVATAVFTAARTLTNPAVSIVSAVDSIDKPRAAQALASDGISGLRRSIWQTRLLLVVLTGAYLAAVAVFTRPLLDFAFHHRYSNIVPEVRLLAGAFFLFCLNQPSETMLIVLRASATMFTTRTATAILTVALLAVARGGGVFGMAVAIAVAQGANLLLLFVAENWAAGRQTRSPVAA